MENLPSEIKIKILTYTDPFTINSISQVNKSFYNFVKNERSYLEKKLYPYQEIKFCLNVNYKVNEVKSNNILNDLKNVISCEILCRHLIKSPVYVSVKGRCYIHGNEYFLYGNVEIVINYISLDLCRQMVINANYNSHLLNGLVTYLHTDDEKFITYEISLHKRGKQQIGSICISQNKMRITNTEFGGDHIFHFYIIFKDINYTGFTIKTVDDLKISFPHLLNLDIETMKKFVSTERLYKEYI